MLDWRSLCLTSALLLAAGVVSRLEAQSPPPTLQQIPVPNGADTVFGAAKTDTAKTDTSKALVHYSVNTSVVSRPRTGAFASDTTLGAVGALLAAPSQTAAPSRTGTFLYPALPTHLLAAQTPSLNIPSKVRAQCPIRLGGVFLRGLGDMAEPSGAGHIPAPASGESPDSRPSAARSSGAASASPAPPDTRLSDANRDWVAANCDVAAFSRTSVTPDTFRSMTKASPLFTPLLYVYASTLYEDADHRGNVGGWQPSMQAWTLRDARGGEVAHPDRGGHWMDFGNEAWAAHWRASVAQQVGQYGARGVVAAELPLGNTFVSNTLQKYKNGADRLKATTRWLGAARSPQQFLLVPSAVGFDSLAGHATLPPPLGSEQPDLAGRVWDEMLPLVSGAWAEGWVTPYWSGEPLPDAQWEMHIEAGDRADRADQVMIACAAYHNDEELEFVLASFLMAYHAQGRLCLQPMPLRKGQPQDAGYNLNVFRAEIAAKSDYFNAPLGQATQERHTLRVEGGDVWRRQFQGGDVYVNSADSRPRTLHFAGYMRRLNGTRIRDLVLPPHHGAILISEADE